ncbi:MAG TPA: prolyl oligopeptidase family serine peptidase [Noviherbaspirillum sp.]|uniref:S9 family peptidase n=1 Tax=Noviherbaspirillum sp. TaxID=1926288 RepID=UPI002D32DBF4|nr:prolyl oligopeptidase family serine peptidase [Noviherbaspirillum sp.]HYD96650.1 prolyl oligopeptidase family serine peptidase [Noviherbaspirillum sp.]
MVSIASRACLFGLVSLLAGCAVSPTHPSLRDADLPELIPLRKFVADTERSGGHQVSPDGSRVLWYGVSGTEAATFVRRLDGGDPAVFRIGRNFPFWAADSRHLIFEDDQRGDENTQIGLLDLARPAAAPRMLTPWPGSRSQVLHAGAQSGRILFTSNRRDPALFDVYGADPQSGQVEPVLENPGDVIQWVMDVDGSVGARVRQQDDYRILQVMNKATRTWKSVYKWSPFDIVRPLRIDRVGGRAWMISNIGRDKAALVELSVAQMRERVLYAHPSVDVMQVVFDAGSGVPVAVRADPDYPQSILLDAALHGELAQAVPKDIVAWRLRNADAGARHLALELYAKKGVIQALYDRASHTLTTLSDNRDDPALAALSDMLPIRYSAADGLPINGYLTLPKTAKRPLPMLVWVHGGPWSRNTWQPGNFDSVGQLFANRGYAVLEVNYRGSLGYGRRHLEAAVGELGGRVQQDIADGVDWAVRSGLADPARVAIGGRSFGGYSALMGLAQQPGRYACAVDIVGVTDLLKAVETFPPYWKASMPMWYRYAGDPARPEDRERLRAISPLHMTAAIAAPLLVVQGASDVRVIKAHSDELVEALRREGKPVDYLVFPDEGHAIRRWQNRLVMYRKIEDFLAGCLGGRSSGFDFYQLGTWLP